MIDNLLLKRCASQRKNRFHQSCLCYWIQAPIIYHSGSCFFLRHVITEMIAIILLTNTGGILMACIVIVGQTCAQRCIGMFPSLCGNRRYCDSYTYFSNVGDEIFLLEELLPGDFSDMLLSYLSSYCESLRKSVFTFVRQIFYANVT